MVKKQLQEYDMPETGWSYFKKKRLNKTLGVMHKDKYWTKELSKRVITFNSTVKVKQLLDALESGYKEEEAEMQVSGFQEFFLTVKNANRVSC